LWTLMAGFADVGVKYDLGFWKSRDIFIPCSYTRKSHLDLRKAIFNHTCKTTVGMT
jgi:hypothetical protein